MNVTEDLKAYIDDELSHERKAEVEAAVAESVGLDREIEEIRDLSRWLSDRIVQPAPMGLDRTLAALDRAQPWRLARALSRAPSYGWALTLALFVGIAAIMPPLAGQGKVESRDAAVTTLSSPQPAARQGIEQKRQAPAESDANIRGGLDMEAGKPKERPETATSPNQIRYSQPLLVRTAELTILVKHVREAQVDATKDARAIGGYVASSSATNFEGAAPEATLTIRVPAERFERAMSSLRNLGQVLAESTAGQDVTVQVADSEARLRVLRASETSYIAMLAKARKVDDSLQIRDRLDNVREEIESVDATRRVLRDQAAQSTITLRLTQVPSPVPPVKNPSWLDSAWISATNRMTSLGKWLVETGINLLVLAPIWLPVVLGLWWLKRRR